MMNVQKQKQMKIHFAILKRMGHKNQGVERENKER